MALIRLDDPSPDEMYSRTLIPVKRHNAKAAWAVFRNGGYEFHVDDSLQQKLTEGSTALRFDMQDGRAIALTFVEQPDPTDPPTS
jgi:hypothetical protein